MWEEASALSSDLRSYASRGHGQRESRRWQRVVNLYPSGPERCNSWNEENAGKNHAEPRSITVTLSQSDSDEDIERGIFQKICAVGEK